MPTMPPPQSNRRPENPAFSREFKHGFGVGLCIGLVYTALAPLAGFIVSGLEDAASTEPHGLLSHSEMALNLGLGTILLVSLVGPVLHLWRRFHVMNPGAQEKRGAWAGVMLWVAGLALAMFLLVVNI